VRWVCVAVIAKRWGAERAKGIQILEQALSSESGGHWARGKKGLPEATSSCKSEGCAHMP
jgi:hypothetical protein